MKIKKIFMLVFQNSCPKYFRLHRHVHWTMITDFTWVIYNILLKFVVESESKGSN